jgi:hypothetical protein
MVRGGRARKRRINIPFLPGGIEIGGGKTRTYGTGPTSAGGRTASERSVGRSYSSLSPTTKSSLPSLTSILGLLPSAPRPGGLDSLLSDAAGLALGATQKADALKSRTVRRALSTLRKASLAADIPELGPQQEQVLRTVLDEGRRLGATPKEMLAAVETGLVESNLRNLHWGDLDSQGWRQERTSQYGLGPRGATNVGASANRFFREIRTEGAGAPTAGLAAQGAQGSARPYAYDEQAPLARSLLQSYRQSQITPKVKQARETLRSLGVKPPSLPNVSGGPRLFQPQPELLKTIPPQQIERFKNVVKVAKAIDSRQLPYIWGGGHGPRAQVGAGVDCSGAVAQLIKAATGEKFRGGVPASGSFGQYLKPGPGAVTVFYNDGHVFAKIGKNYWGTSHANRAGGAGFIPTAYEQGEAMSGKYAVGHIPGMTPKLARALGVNVNAGQSFPGMALGAGGTMASILPGAGANKGAPGFSNRPIQLSQVRQNPLSARAATPQGVGDTEASLAAQLSGNPEEDPADVLAAILSRQSYRPRRRR